MSSAVDLSNLSPPDVVEDLDFEALLTGIRDQMIARVPELANTLDLESEPVVKALEVFALGAITLRARVNDGARAVMLATSTGADLENLVALYGVERLVIAPADLEANPPVPAVMESDDALRRRGQFALEGFSTAGPRDAYRFHALSADGRNRDVRVFSSRPGTVDVIVHAEDAAGAPITSTVDLTAMALSADDVRPICDTTVVRPASVVRYDITADLIVGTGPDNGVVRAAAIDSLNSYLRSNRKIGRDVPISAIYAALHVSEVVRVDLEEPLSDIVIGGEEIAIVDRITVTLNGI